jgi:hypothetical protein
MAWNCKVFKQLRLRPAPPAKRQTSKFSFSRIQTPIFRFHSRRFDGGASFRAVIYGFRCVLVVESLR